MQRGPHGTVPGAPHPYAQYPYDARREVDPRYVGPRWAAPAPRAPLPPRRPAKGGSAVRVVLLVLGLLLVGPAIFAGVVLLGALSLADGLPEKPVSTAPVPTGTIAPIGKPEVSATIKGGKCTEVANERDEDSYLALREGGSAPRLRGKVAMLHVQLGGGEGAWPKNLQIRMDEAALLSQRFYLDQAKRYGITDLKYDVIPWPLRAAKVALPKLSVNSHQLLDVATERRLRDQSQAAIEQAFGSSLDSVIEAYKSKGYDSVGFLIYLPVTTDARDFAWRASKFEREGQPELAILFPRTDVLDHLAVVVAHEGLHLFGADDLYRMKTADKADAHDVMGEYCTGFRQTTVDDVTAYAIGWRADPPSRPYGIVDR